MTPIQQDPARRIRRIQRWLGKCGEMIPSAHWLYPFPQKFHRWDAADKLFAAELDWLCRHAASLMTANAEYWSSIYGDLYRETLAKLTDAEQTIAEQKVRIDGFEAEMEARLEMERRGY